MRTFSPARAVRLPAVAAATLFIATGLTAAVTPPASAATSASVTVNVGQSLATIPTTGSGMNVAVWDGEMNGSATPGLLRDAGIGLVRYPGGSYGDIFHWSTTTAEGGFVAPGTDFDSFMGTVRAANSQAILIANYGTGTAQEAADWVRYANVTKGYGVKYWEIGNEVYGNGTYGADWEADNHSTKNATTYANYLVQYANAMKAVDPTIKIGAVLTSPGGWPDGITASGDPGDWNHTVMSIAASKIDFVVVHYYPYSTTAAQMQGKPRSEVPGMAHTLRSLIQQYGGSRANAIGIAVTETSGNLYSDASPSGVFAPEDYLVWMENGAFNIDWWDLRNGTDCSNVVSVEGGTDYGDGGIVSSGASCEPPVNTPFPAYYGLQMITKLGTPGDTLVATSSSNSLLSPHAVKRANGDVGVMLINQDPNNDATVNLSFSGFNASSTAATVYTYRKNGTSITSTSTGSSTVQTVPAYSIVVVQVHPSGTGSS